MKTMIQAAVVTLFAASAAHAQQAVQWRVEDGGNGHWYVIGGGQMAMIPLADARAGAAAAGGHLITITSREEGLFVNGLTGGYSQAVWWLGVHRGSDGAWRWDTGEPWGYTDFSGHPWCTWGSEGIIAGNMNANCWCTSPGCTPPWHTASSGVWVRGAIEWSADCNGDGVVDYGQLVGGQLGDQNSNWKPDICECDQFPGLPDCCVCCRADMNQDGSVNGADIGVILAFWGPAGAVFPRADINRDGDVDGGDLGLLLAHWGGCP